MTSATGNNPAAHKHRLGAGIESLFAGIMALVAVVGCAGETATTQPSGVRDRQDAALKDPFSYGPTQADAKKAAESKKNKPEPTLKSDWDRFWNP